MADLNHGLMLLAYNTCQDLMGKDLKNLKEHSMNDLLLVLLTVVFFYGILRVGRKMARQPVRVKVPVEKGNRLTRR